jgi:hypothetical protein
MRTTATAALTRYLQGVRKKLTKQPMVMESFTPHLVHILLRLPVVLISLLFSGAYKHNNTHHIGDNTAGIPKLFFNPNNPCINLIKR